MSDSIVSASPKLPTNRRFGWFFTAVFVVVAAYSNWKGLSALGFASLVVASLFLAATLFAPQMLAPLNRLWYGLGMLLGKVVNPIVLGIIFFVLISPVSLLTRLFGRDELKIKKRRVESYWIDRSPSGPPPNSFKDQY